MDNDYMLKVLAACLFFHDDVFFSIRLSIVFEMRLP